MRFIKNLVIFKKIIFLILDEISIHDTTTIEYIFESELCFLYIPIIIHSIRKFFRRQN